MSSQFRKDVPILKVFKQPVTALPSSSYFDNAISFAMIRGGHVDVAIMGGLQVDEGANLANWAVPGVGRCSAWEVRWTWPAGPKS